MPCCQWQYFTLKGYPCSCGSDSRFFRDINSWRQLIKNEPRSQSVLHKDPLCMKICIFYSLFMAEVVEYEGALCSPRQGQQKSVNSFILVANFWNREPRLTVDREKTSYSCYTRKSIRVFVLNWCANVFQVRGEDSTLGRCQWIVKVVVVREN